MQFISSIISGAVGLIFFIAWLALIVYAVLDILRNSSMNQNTKLIWFVIIIVAPILGSLLYIFWGRNQNFL